ncbi:hypothetical protein SAMN05421505_12550 [Sinosporangium album]|uniref:Uncharacterized protein n=1 Tax=Sinosporangium album TaxID=504805 RepID=A0A1G8G2C9_9ACTN|nr:hypothetical protein [Sinosporangium album]SDH88406.1 hypothetical protein SAMN05421505_12550 [Sinosporangium album]
MNSRLAIGALTAAVGGSLLLSSGVATASTSAPLGVKISHASPYAASGKGGGNVVVDFDIRATKGSKVSLQLRPENRSQRVKTVHAKLIREGDRWRYQARFDRSDYDGRWVAVADAYDRHGKKVTDTAGFYVKVKNVKIKDGKSRKSRTKLDGFRAHKSGYGKYRQISFSGNLRELEHGRWKGLGSEKVEIYFRDRDSRSWKRVTSVKSGGHGSFKAKVHGKRDGYYRAYFNGGRDYFDSVSHSSRVNTWR